MSQIPQISNSALELLLEELQESDEEDEDEDEEDDELTSSSFKTSLLDFDFSCCCFLLWSILRIPTLRTRSDDDDDDHEEELESQPSLSSSNSKESPLLALEDE